MQAIFISKINKTTRGERGKLAASKEAIAPVTSTQRRSYIISSEHSIQLNRKRSINAKNLWKKEPHRKKMSARISKSNIKRWKNPEYKRYMLEIASLALKKKWKNDIEYRQHMAIICGNRFRNKKHNKVHILKSSLAMKKFYRSLKGSKKRLDISKSNRAFYKSPAGIHCRLKLSKQKLGNKNLKNRWKNSTYRNQMSVMLQKRWKNSEYIANQSSIMTKRNIINWRNPGYRKHMDSVRLNQLKQCRKGPNKSELKALQLINSYSRIRFKYVGAGRDAILINGYSPDFINKRKRIIILYNGIHWHLDVFGLTNTPQNKKIRERIEKKPFIKAGYRVRFIWEDEFNKGEIKWKKIYC